MTRRRPPLSAALGPAWLAPLGDPLAGVTSADQARAVLADLNAHVADALEARDQVLDYLLPQAPATASRARLPGPPYAEGAETTRRSRILKLRIGPRDKGTTGHLFVGFYPDGELGELFVQLGRGLRSTLAGGLAHWGAKMFSLARQHGVPLATLLRQMRYDKDASGGTPYGPDGPVKGTAGVGSLVDYLGLVLERVAEEEAAAHVTTATTTHTDGAAVAGRTTP